MSSLYLLTVVDFFFHSPPSPAHVRSLVRKRVDTKLFDYFLGDSNLFKPVGVHQNLKVFLSLSYLCDYVLKSAEKRRRRKKNWDRCVNACSVKNIKLYFFFFSAIVQMWMACGRSLWATCMSSLPIHTYTASFWNSSPLLFCNPLGTIRL